LVTIVLVGTSVGLGLLGLLAFAAWRQMGRIEQFDADLLAVAAATDGWTFDGDTLQGPLTQGAFVADVTESMGSLRWEVRLAEVAPWAAFTVGPPGRRAAGGRVGTGDAGFDAAVEVVGPKLEALAALSAPTRALLADAVGHGFTYDGEVWRAAGPVPGTAQAIHGQVALADALATLGPTPDVAASLEQQLRDASSDAVMAELVAAWREIEQPWPPELAAHIIRRADGAAVAVAVALGPTGIPHLQDLLETAPDADVRWAALDALWDAPNHAGLLEPLWSFVPHEVHGATAITRLMASEEGRARLLEDLEAGPIDFRIVQALWPEVEAPSLTVALATFVGHDTHGAEAARWLSTRADGRAHLLRLLGADLGPDVGWQVADALWLRVDDARVLTALTGFLRDEQRSETVIRRLADRGTLTHVPALKQVAEGRGERAVQAARAISTIQDRAGGQVGLLSLAPHGEGQGAVSIVGEAAEDPGSSDGHGNAEAGGS